MNHRNNGSVSIPQWTLDRYLDVIVAGSKRTQDRNYIETETIIHFDPVIILVPILLHIQNQKPFVTSNYFDPVIMSILHRSTVKLESNAPDA